MAVAERNPNAAHDTHTGVKSGTCVLRLDRTRIIGIVNATDDSFSGDGLGSDFDSAVAQGDTMFSSGADIVDVGGESTRPGAETVPARMEIERTIPVVERLAGKHPGRVSIDTYKPMVAKSALSTGATIVNDVSGLRDPKMIEVVAEFGASVIIMHMKGEPKTMQNDPKYDDVVAEVTEFLKDRIDAAESNGIERDRIMVDPGIGFGKTLDHNIEILARLGEFKGLGKPIVIGASRKSFIGNITGLPAEQRLEGSLAAAIIASCKGADFIRTHDVEATSRALKVADAIHRRISH